MPTPTARICSPTRAALMTADINTRYGIEDLAGPLPTQATPLPQRLKAVGYKTLMVGKWHLGATAGFTPNDRGFDEFFGFLGGGSPVHYPAQTEKGNTTPPSCEIAKPLKRRVYLTDAFLLTKRWPCVSTTRFPSPFFLYLAFNAVHTPLQTIDKYRNRFPHNADRQRQTYAAMLSSMTMPLADWSTELETIKQLDRTLIVFTSDNEDQQLVMLLTAQATHHFVAPNAKRSKEGFEFHS